MNLLVAWVTPLNNNERDRRLQNLRWISSYWQTLGVQIMVISCGPFPGEHFCEVIETPSDDFRRGVLFNIGFHHTNSNVILLGETDCYCSGIVETITLAAAHGCAAGWSRARELTREESDHIFFNPGCDPFPFETDQKFGNHRMEGGLIAVRRDVYEDINGCDERYMNLRGYDNELVIRLRDKTGDLPLASYTMYHLWHSHSPMKYYMGNMTLLDPLVSAKVKQIDQPEFGTHVHTHSRRV